MADLDNTQENIIVSENEELKSAFIKFNNSYLERFSSLDNSIKSLNTSIEKLGNEDNIKSDTKKEGGKISSFGYDKTLSTIQKKLFSFKEKIDEINLPIFNSFLKYLEANEDSNEKINTKLREIKEGLDKTLESEKKNSGFLDLIFNGIGGVLKKGFESITKLISTFAKNFFTKGILVRAFGAVLLGLLGTEFMEKIGVPNYWAKPLGYAAAGYAAGSFIGTWIGGLGGSAVGPVGTAAGAASGSQIGAWIGAGIGAVYGTGVAMFENDKNWKEKYPTDYLANTISDDESGGNYESIYDNLNQFKKGKKLTDMVLSDVLSMQDELIEYTRTNPRYHDKNNPAIPEGKGTSAIGKYQTTKSNIIDFLKFLSTKEGIEFNKEYNFSRNSKFDEKFQNAMFQWIIYYKHGRGLREYVKSKEDNGSIIYESQYINEMRKEWPTINSKDIKAFRNLRQRLKNQITTPPTEKTSDKLNAVSYNEMDSSSEELSGLVNDINGSLNSLAQRMIASTSDNGNITTNNIFDVKEPPTPGLIDYAWHKLNFYYTGSPHSNVFA